MEFKGLTSASHMSLQEAGYGSEEGQLGSEISGAVSGVTTPGASRLQASQLTQRSTTMQRLHGPASTNESFSEAMLSGTRNPIQDTVMDACHTIGLRYHSTGLWASCPPSLFLAKEKVQVRFLATKAAPQYSKFGNRLKRTPQDLGFHLGTVTGVHTESATLQFLDGTTHTIKNPGLRRNEKEYTFQNPAVSVRPQLAGHHELLTPPLLHPQEYILNATLRQSHARTSDCRRVLRIT